MHRRRGFGDRFHAACCGRPGRGEFDTEVVGHGRQIGDEVGGPLVAVLWVLLHQPVEDLGKPFRHVGPEGFDRRRRILLMLQELLHHRAVGEWSPAHEHEKNGAAERVEVAADVGRPWVAGLFGRDVVEGAERHAADGEVLVAGHVVQPRQAHVHDAGPAGGRDDDV